MPAEARLASDHRAIDAILAGAFAALEAGDPAPSHRALDRAWMRLAVHIRAEHKALFPHLLVTRPDLAESLTTLRIEHDAFMAGMARLLQRLHVASPDLAAVLAALRELDGLLQSHNRREEEVIYPGAGEDPDLDARVALELSALPERHSG